MTRHLSSCITRKKETRSSSPFDVSDIWVPYHLDAWTGEQSEEVAFERTKHGISLCTTLSQGQTAIFAFAPSQDPTRPHVTSKSSNVEKLSRGPQGELVALINNGDAAKLTFSDGQELVLENDDFEYADIVLFAPIELTPWDLTIESWIPDPTNSTSRSTVIPIPLGQQEDLIPWTQIPNMQNVSGVGIYSTSFTLPKDFSIDPNRTAILIHFGPILNTLRAWINDKPLGPIDTADAQVDISTFLRPNPEANTVRIEVASNLFNAVKVRAGWIESLDQGPLFLKAYGEGVEFQPFGLFGPVTVRRLRREVVWQNVCDAW